MRAKSADSTPFDSSYPSARSCSRGTARRLLPPRSVGKDSEAEPNSRCVAMPTKKKPAGSKTKKKKKKAASGPVASTFTFEPISTHAVAEEKFMRVVLQMKDMEVRH